MVQFSITFGIILIGVSPALGCLCNDLTIEKMLAIYDYVLVGSPITNVHPDSVAARLLNEEGYGSEVYFKVDKIVKGDIKDNIVVVNQVGNGNCILKVKLGDKYLLFGHIKNYAPALPADLSPIVEIDTVTGEEKIIGSFCKGNIVGDYIKTLNDKFDIVHTSLCGLFHEKTKFHKPSRRWIKKRAKYQSDRR